MVGDIAIVGGGICGLSIGWYLARRGAKVTLFEREEAGRGATWAAAGLLQPKVDYQQTSRAYSELTLKSGRLWQRFARELETASGVKIGHRAEGTLILASNSEEESQLKVEHDLLDKAGVDAKWMDSEEARDLEPRLSPRIVAALLNPLGQQVDNRKVAVALKTAFTAAGGRLYEHKDVRGIATRGDRTIGIRVENEFLSSEIVILAAGAWSNTLVGIPENARPPVRPVKGQMLALGMKTGDVLLSHVIRHQDVYLVPRRDGRLLVGATVEEQGFDKSVTAAGLLELLGKAVVAVPEARNLPVVETWAGIRPGSPDGAPILGPTSVKGLIMATGHFRNGILLAPITASALSNYVLSGKMPELIAPFTIERFRKRSDMQVL